MKTKALSYQAGQSTRSQRSHPEDLQASSRAAWNRCRKYAGPLRVPGLLTQEFSSRYVVLCHVTPAIRVEESQTMVPWFVFNLDARFLDMR
jgi:hypothetical protein